MSFDGHYGAGEMRSGPLHCAGSVAQTIASGADISGRFGSSVGQVPRMWYFHSMIAPAMVVRACMDAERDVGGGRLVVAG